MLRQENSDNRVSNARSQVDTAPGLGPAKQQIEEAARSGLQIGLLDLGEVCELHAAREFYSNALQGNVNYAPPEVLRWLKDHFARWFEKYSHLEVEENPLRSKSSPVESIASNSGASSASTAPGELTQAEFENVMAHVKNMKLVDIKEVLKKLGRRPGTWYVGEGDMGEQARQQRVPVIGGGQGVWSFVHIDDAAAATTAALDSAPGIYNVVDADPTPQRLWLPAFARAVGAPVPPQITEQEALATFGPDTVPTRLRGASNEKARRKFNFRPRSLEWLRMSQTDPL